MEKTKEDFFLQFVYQKPYSFDAPSHILANSIVNALMDRGLSKKAAQNLNKNHWENPISQGVNLCLLF